MNKEKAIENLNRLKQIGVFRSGDEYERFFDEIIKVDKETKKEAQTKEVEEIIAIKEIEEMLE